MSTLFFAIVWAYDGRHVVPGPALDDRGALRGPRRWRRANERVYLASSPLSLSTTALAEGCVRCSCVGVLRFSVRTLPPPGNGRSARVVYVADRVEVGGTVFREVCAPRWELDFSSASIEHSRLIQSRDRVAYEVYARGESIEWLYSGVGVQCAKDPHGSLSSTAILRKYFPLCSLQHVTLQRQAHVGTEDYHSKSIS
ncbi:hypothetical protein MRX96_055904 [Rhipicephalus microplus]